jgi:hypothetical protein
MVALARHQFHAMYLLRLTMQLGDDRLERLRAVYRRLPLTEQTQRWPV